MWVQASRYLCRNPNITETTRKLLSCCELCLNPIRQVQNATHERKTKAQKVVNIKYTNKGRRRIEIYPPPSIIPSQSVILPVCILILISLNLLKVSLLSLYFMR